MIIDYIKRLKSIYKTCNFKHVSLFYFLIIISLALAILETFFLGLVYSFINNFVEAGDDKVISNLFLLDTYFNDKDKIQNFLLLLMICLALFVAIFKLINLKISSYLYFNINTVVSSHLFNMTLYSNFNFHQIKNTSSLIATITQKSKSVGEVTFFLLGIIKSSIMLVFITAVAISISSTSFLIFFLMMLIIFLLLYKSIKLVLKKLGIIVASENEKIIKSLQESYSNIALIIVHNVENFFSEHYKKSIFNLRKSEGDIVFTSGVPYIIVNFIFIGSFLVIIYFFKDGSFLYLPILAVWLLAMQKLFPSFNEIFGNLGTIKSLSQNFKDTENLLFQLSNKKRVSNSKEDIAFDNEIQFKNVSFKYDNSKDFILENINLTIKKNSMIGIAGKTGVGKSSLINLLVGFFAPTEGLITSDSKQISYKNIFNWQKKISIVPQNNMLLDDSIEKNILFNNNKRDEKKLNLSINLACLGDVVNELNQKENNLIGENGKRISGGQKQRVGIARAIYRDTEILILDESFNSLDYDTKVIISNNLKKLNKTTFLITHDKQDYKLCDTVFLIENKKVLKLI